jgi:hypothetical protein
VPQLVGESVGRDRRSRFEQQERQQRCLPRTTEDECLPVPHHLDRPEEPELDLVASWRVHVWPA